MSTNPDGLRLLFAGGGTGGHLYPAIAIADRISALLRGKIPVDINFVGTKRGLEYRIGKELGYPLHLINIRGLSRSLTLKNLLLPFLMAGALAKSSMLISRLSPDLVIGTGGYVSWPIVKAAGWKNIPTVLQEQNSYPGMVTRTAALKAKRVYLGFEGARQYLPDGTDIIVTGNPIRSDIATGNREESLEYYGLDKNKKTILVLGGSQGARSINSAIISGLQKFKDDFDFQLLWQTGKRDYKDVEATIDSNRKGCALFPFENNMSMVYAAADLVIARAGALTLAELQACSLPSILVPYPHAAEDHQMANAREHAAHGFAEIMSEEKILSGNLLAFAAELLTNGKADQMSRAAERSAIGKISAVDNICNDILRLVKLQDFVEEASEC